MLKFFLSLFTLLYSLSLVSQTMEVIIVDQNQIPLTGASVFDQKQTWMRLSGEQGEVKIPYADSISIQYLGLKTHQTSWETLHANDGIVSLQSEGFSLPEIVVKKDLRRKDLSQEKLSISALEIQSSQLSTPVDALADAGGAFIQKSQHGGGSPIIRGFEANRVLLMIDGVRLNNAIYRSGHLQNGITIDESALADIELTYGPGALAYGSDALGGVLHFKTKEYLPATSLGMNTGWNGQAFIRLATGQQEATSHLGLAWQGHRWSSYTALTASQFGDAVAGDKRPSQFPNFGQRLEFIERINGQDSIVQNNEPNRQIGSGYNQLDLLQKIIWQPAINWLVKLNFQLSTSTNIPRYDALSEYRNNQLRFSDWHYGPQQRFLGSLLIQSDKKRWYSDWFRIIVSRQKIAEDRFQRQFNDLWTEASLVDVTANNLTFDFQKRWNNEHSLQYGFDARLDQVEASAYQENIDNKERLYDINTRYPSDGSNLNALGTYAQYRYFSRDSTLLAEAGLRLSRQFLDVVFNADDPIKWPLDYLDGVGGISNAFTWSSGIRWRPAQWIYRLHVASGFRAPNVDDFAKFREKDGFIQVPNPDLNPEQSISGDFSLERSFGNQLTINATVYGTVLEDIIVRENFQLPDGNTFFISTGDSLFVQANINSGKARLWGFSLSGKWRPTQHWYCNTQVQYTHGERLLNLDNGSSVFVPLDHIPPLFGNFSVNYQKAKIQLGLNAQFQAAKKLTDYAVTSVEFIGDKLVYQRLGSSDNLENSPIDPETGEYTGSYAWWTLKFQSSYKINSNFKFRLTINNLFDQHYRTFSSGISAQGRMVVLGLYAWF